MVYHSQSHQRNCCGVKDFVWCFTQHKSHVETSRRDLKFLTACPLLCNLEERGCPGFLEAAFWDPQSWDEVFCSCMQHPRGFSWQGVWSLLKITAREVLQRVLLGTLGEVNLPQAIPCHSQAAQSRLLAIHSNFLCFLSLTLTSLTDGER